MPNEPPRARIRDERRRWRDLVDAVGPARLDEAGAMGEWTFGDLAGHLAGWREHRLRELEAAARGEPAPAPPWPTGLAENDEINDWIHDAPVGHGPGPDRRLRRDLRAPRIGDRGAPETMAADPGAFAWMEGTAPVDGDWGTHLRDEHEPLVRAWLAGDAR